MRFFNTFLRTVATLAVVYAVAAAVVNPRRELVGHYFPALQPNSRATKLSLLDAYQRITPPRGLILGSSRSMNLAPPLFTKATGQPFFNLAVFSGRAEDFLVLFRAAISRDPGIREIVVGLDPDGFDPGQPSELELQNNAELVQLLRGSPFTPFDWAEFVGRRLTGLFTVGYVRDVAVSVLAARHPPTPAYVFGTDGSVTYPKFEQEIAAGQFPFAQAIATCARDGASHLASVDRVDTARFNDVRGLVSEARGRGVTVVLWAPPMHPRYADAVDANARARAHLDEILGRFRAIAAESSVPFVDLTRGETFGSDPADWYDCIHYRSANAARIAGRLTAVLDSIAAHGF